MGRLLPYSIFWLCLVTIAAAVALGGATAGGFAGDIVVQLLAVPLLTIAGRDWVIGMINQTQRRFTDSLLYAALIGLALILIIQLTPWPPTLLSFADRSAMGPPLSTESSWRGVSATPDASWAGAMSLIPVLGVFFGVSQLAAPARFRLACVVSGLGAVSLLLGFAQLMQGPDSNLRFFAITNPSDAVGFFANRNHFAAFLYSSLVFASVAMAFLAKRFVKARKIGNSAILWFVLSAVLVISILAGIAIARSRAGILLSMLALAGIVMIVASAQGAMVKGRNRQRSMPPLAMVTVGLALVFAAQFGFHRFATRFEADPLQDLRLTLSPTTFELALNSLPFGTGIGSFVEVYANHEKAVNLFSGYANHAHNDWAEIALETGLLGVITVAVFLMWLAGRSAQVWRQKLERDAEQDVMLQRGATLVIGLLLLHSFVDYPLRTTALSVLFAFACALLTDTPRASPHAPRIFAGGRKFAAALN